MFASLARNVQIVVTTAALIVCGVAFASDNGIGEGVRYKDYQFEPKYPDPLLEDDVKARINPTLKFDGHDFWEVSEAKTVRTDNGALFFAYDVTTKEGMAGARTMARRAAEIGIQKKRFPAGHWQSIGMLTEDGLKVLENEDGRGTLYSDFHYGWDFYGCIEDDWIFKAALFEGKPEMVFSVTGHGDKTTSVMADRITLTGYSGETGAQLIKTHLLLANYTILQEWEDDQSGYAFPIAYDNPQVTPLVEEDMAGRKQYAKVFFTDFDRNDRLDALVWYRKYRSEKLTESEKPGFVFEEEWFEHLEENAASTAFDTKPIQAEQAHAWLTEHKLHWKDGYPSENRCRGDNANLAGIPMMVGVKDAVIE